MIALLRGADSTDFHNLGSAAEREWKDTAAMIANERFENRHARKAARHGKS